MKTYNFRNRNYKVFNVKMYDSVYEVIVTKEEYRNTGGLALQLWDINGEYGEPEPFATLTVNLGDFGLDENLAFVKNYSENEQWADSLAKEIGGKNTGIIVPTGFVSVPLYDFSKLNIFND